MKKPTAYLTLSILVLVLDQAAKLIVVRTIQPFEEIRVLPFLQLVNVKNTGAAFGLFQGLGNPFFIAVSLIAVAVVTVMLIRGKEDGLSLSFILGGALGNLLDRLRLGYVVDFIDLHAGRYHWPAFNVADSALSVGILLLLLSTLLKGRT